MNWIKALWMEWLGIYFSKHKSESFAMKIEDSTGMVADFSDADWGTGARGEVIK